MYNMTLQEIENYGSDIVIDVSNQMTDLLRKTKAIDLDQTGKSLSDSSVETSAISKSVGKVGRFPAIFGVGKFLSKYVSIENRVVSLESGVVAERERLSDVLNALYESLGILRGTLVDLESAKANLEIVVEDLKTSDEDGILLQAATHRLQTLTTTCAVVKQECTKTVLIIKENKEVQAQLQEASDNLIPIFKVMLMNVLGAKTNAEAIKLKKNLSTVANKIIIENAKQIDETAQDLIKGREEPLIKAETITEANKILQGAIEKVQKSALAETSVNLKAVEDMQMSVKMLANLETLEGAL